MDQHHRRAAVTVALDVHGARANGNAEEIGVDGRSPGRVVVEWRSACRIAGKVVVQGRLGQRFRVLPLFWRLPSFRHPTVHHSTRRAALSSMADETYGEERARNLEALLRNLAARIVEMDARGELLKQAGELMRLIGDVRSELFHYEVRATYDTPEVAENRRIVAEATDNPDNPWQKTEWTPDEDDEPTW